MLLKDFIFLSALTVLAFPACFCPDAGADEVLSKTPVNEPNLGLVSPNSPAGSGDKSETSSKEKSKLRDFEREITQPPEDDSGNDRDHDRGRHGKHENHEKEHICAANIDPLELITDPLMQIFARAFLEFLLSPIKIPRAMLEENDSDNFGYQKYPFFSSDGCLDKSDKNWTLNPVLTTHFVRDNITGNQIAANLVFSNRISLDFSHSSYAERLKTGFESLSFDEFLVSYIFAKNDYVNFRFGGGISGVSGMNDHDGAKLCYQIRWFRKPFQLRLNLGMTSFSNSNTMYDTLAEISYHRENLEFGAGFKNISTGNQSINGPVFSVGLWF